LPAESCERHTSTGGDTAGEPRPASDAVPASLHAPVLKAGVVKVAGHVVLEAEHRGSVVAIDLSAIPDGEGTVYVRTAGGERRIVPAREMRLLRVVSG